MNREEKYYKLIKEVERETKIRAFITGAIVMAIIGIILLSYLI